MINASILRKLRFCMILFGIGMGFVFPVYANFFVHFKEGMVIYFVIGCIIAGITVGVVSFLFVKVILIKKLLIVSRVANEIANGNVSEKIGIKSNDEVGTIVDGLNEATNCINLFLREMRQTFNLSEQILKRAQNNTGELADRNIDHTIKTVNSATKILSGHSDEILSAVGKSKSAVKSWQNSLAITIENADKLSEGIENLANHSERVNHILKVIDEIAGKTNMVSLNASIEAANAGVYGKSFAVVAHEIRQLAYNVGASSREISEYLTQITDNIESARNSASGIKDLVDQNCTQSSDIYRNLKEIESISHSNKSADQQLVQSVQNLNNAFNEINSIFNQLSDNTKNLQSIYANYKV